MALVLLAVVIVVCLRIKQGGLKVISPAFDPTMVKVEFVNPWDRDVFVNGIRVRPGDKYILYVQVPPGRTYGLQQIEGRLIFGSPIAYIKAWTDPATGKGVYAVISPSDAGIAEGHTNGAANLSGG